MRDNRRIATALPPPDSLGIVSRPRLTPSSKSRAITRPSMYHGCLLISVRPPERRRPAAPRPVGSSPPRKSTGMAVGGMAIDYASALSPPAGSARRCARVACPEVDHGAPGLHLPTTHDLRRRHAMKAACCDHGTRADAAIGGGDARLPSEALENEPDHALARLSACGSSCSYSSASGALRRNQHPSPGPEVDHARRAAVPCERVRFSSSQGCAGLGLVGDGY